MGSDGPDARESWELAVSRDDLSQTRLRPAARPDVGPGEALLEVDRVGLTANNVTYAVMGEAMGYWRFFPTDAGWGVVPLWGFADVVASEVDGLEAGSRVYGYLPSAGHLLVRPDRVDEGGFRDASDHRAELPSPYNSYTLTTGDPAYAAGVEDLLVLYRPLFYTSFLLADRLTDDDLGDAEVVMLSSASSKTAYGTAFELAEAGVPVIGLTSRGNVGFVEELGCYEEVLAYDDVEELSSSVPAVYADVAGDPQLNEAVRSHLGDALVRSIVVGVTHHEAATGASGGPSADEMFFAPTQIEKRAADWGRAELDRRFADAWRRFVSTLDEWVRVVVHDGPEALESAWRETFRGRSDPGEGHVFSL